MKCSIIIRAYNEERHIAKLLVGIGQQAIKPHEIILVDSGSTDSTRAIAQNFGAKIVEIPKADFTFGRALNVGCRAATGEILVFVSAHVYPTRRDWLASLCRPFSNENISLSYGRQIGNHLNHFSEHQIFAKWFPAQSEIPQVGYFCNNANAAIRRKAWSNRPYDENLTGLEDLAWAKQAQADGEEIAYVSQAEIVHVHEESWRSVRNRYRREAIAMTRIEPNAHFSLGDFMSLFVRNVWGDARSATKQRRLHKEMAGILRFRFNQFLGTYQGYRDKGGLSRALRERFYYPAALNVDDTAGEHDIDHIDYSRLMRAPVNVSARK
ncbi:glycosyltransferase family 2 protein [Pelagibacterium sp. 26DY04]|uniref:glycosyltransferase n=1 Tax=Pelagibacterium sp. 26DY04 TaxID=2967130 RepID=UPI002815A537|nr:glycosyltransferase family 2 protein [Pelagibacterium sp. 26DY04]WMT87477.1 glycosyltransferase family 2 protein [Pelagibacterium sp. 26DY04]